MINFGGCMNKNIRGRLLFVLVIFIAMFSVVIFKLACINIFDSKALKEQVIYEKTLERDIIAERGMILDRNGSKLVFSMNKYKISIDTKLMTDEVETIKKIAAALLMKEEDIKVILDSSNKSVKKIVDIYDKDLVDKLRLEYVKGIQIDEIKYRHYPNDELAAQVLGFTRVKNNEGDVEGYGIEIKYNDDLTGKNGKLETEKDQWNNELVYSDRFETEAVNGNNIVLTIDKVMQFYLENAIKTGYELNNPVATHAILMDVNTGDVLAMGSYPTFNPNELGVIQDMTEEDIKNITLQEQSDLLTLRWKNHMVQDTYELGSTLKLVTTAIALEENFFTPDSVFNIGNKIRVADRNIKCWYYPRSHGPETLTQAVENSCNPVFVQIGQAIGKDIFYDYFEAFGLTEKTGIQLPHEVNPIVYTREETNEVELATMTFGQGIANTPIQVITAISAIVNGGYLLEPHLIKQIEDEDGNIIEETKRTVRRQVISEATSIQMREIMRSVVENGSGKAVYIEGIPIGAKTGTSEKPFQGGYSEDKLIASFIAVAPIVDPQIALYVFIDEPENGEHGGTIAGPIAREILENILPYMGLEKSFDSVNDLVNIPNLVGMTYGEGKKILTKLGFNYMTTPANFEDESKIIINQYPKAGTLVKINEPINMLINDR